MLLLRKYAKWNSLRLCELAQFENRFNRTDFIPQLDSIRFWWRFFQFTWKILSLRESFSSFSDTFPSYLKFLEGVVGFFWDSWWDSWWLFVSLEECRPFTRCTGDPSTEQFLFFFFLSLLPAEMWNSSSLFSCNFVEGGNCGLSVNKAQKKNWWKAGGVGGQGPFRQLIYYPHYNRPPFCRFTYNSHYNQRFKFLLPLLPPLLRM